MKSGTIDVLHVDDDQDVAETTAVFLEEMAGELRVETAPDADEALVRLGDDQFDCIVSDYEMPGKNGIEFLRTVREDHPNLPFILFTGRGSEGIASEAISAGVTDYLQKRMGTDQYTLLLNCIRNAVEAHRAREAAEETKQWARTMLEHSSDYLFVMDASGTLSYVSPSVRRVLGYESEELVGENAFEFVHPDDVERASEVLFETVREAGAERTAEFRVLDARGEIR